MKERKNGFWELSEDYRHESSKELKKTDVVVNFFDLLDLPKLEINVNAFVSFSAGYCVKC